jgi:hypothetical protein
MSMMFNLGNAFFLLIFLLSAAVQYNDPDSLRWIAIYTAAAALCLAQYIVVLPRWVPAALLAACLIWIGLLLPKVVGAVSVGEVFESITMRTRAVEEAREIGGLLLVVLWSAVLAYRRR